MTICARPNSFHRLIAVLSILTLAVLALGCSDVNSDGDDVSRTASDVELLGLVTFETGFTFEETEVGGLSGITFDPERGVYYVLSDDRGSVNPARFYTVDIDIADGSLDEGDVIFLEVTTLTDDEGIPFASGSIDPEGIELAGDDMLYISSEGDAGNRPAIEPFVNGFNLSGAEVLRLPLPEKFKPDEAKNNGVRDNKAFESLTITPDQRFLYTAVENALLQDGPAASLEEGSPSRIVEFNLEDQSAQREFIYRVDPIPVPPVPLNGSADNGLVDLQAVDNLGTMLAMERSYAEGAGNTVKIFETSVEGATDVTDVNALDGGDSSPPVFDLMTKRLVVDIISLGIEPDNLEGMTFGPVLPDGRMLLILTSDNNFNPRQTTQFIALAVDLGP